MIADIESLCLLITKNRNWLNYSRYLYCNDSEECPRISENSGTIKGENRTGGSRSRIIMDSLEHYGFYILLFLYTLFILVGFLMSIC